MTCVTYAVTYIRYMRGGTCCHLSEALRLGLYCEWALLSRLVGSTEYVGPTTQYLSSPSVSSVDLVLTNGKRMVKALPMALPGASQGCRTLGYDRGGDKAPQTRSNGCREIVFGHDAPLWSEPFNRSRTVMAAVRVAHPPAPRRHPRELSYHPQHP